MVPRARALKIGGLGIAGVLVLGVVVVGALATTGVLATPTVESTRSQWGTVGANTTAIETTVSMTNPNPVGVPGLLSVTYTATLNGVTLAEGTERGVGFGVGANDLAFTTEMENARIADWWVEHVNDGEESKLSLSATVSGPGFSREVPASASTIETDILGGFTSNETRTVTVRDEPLLRISEETAAWGEADAAATPIEFSSTVANVHDYDVTLDGVEYVVTMNGVELGRERRDSGIDVAPGETGELTVTVALNSRKMADWWPEHVRDDERSRLTVEMYGLVDDDGERERVPLRIFEKSLTLQTDMLGEGETTVEPVASPDRGTGFEAPEVSATTQEWGAVTDAETDIRTRATLSTPEQELNDLLTLDVRQETAINGVRVAGGSTTVEEVRAGTTPLDFTVVMDNGEVPEWWARHLNQGERSQVVSSPMATADVGVTKFDEPLDDRTGAVETDLLAGMNGERSETVTVRGEEALTVERVDSSWKDATPEAAPIDVRTTVTNELPTSMTVRDVHYRVTLNDVVLADRTAPDSFRLSGGETRTLPIEMRLDNQRMEKWWPTHIRNGERSNLNVTVTVTADSRFGSERRTLDSLGQDTVVETDMLNATADG
jgi:LEA14-like dessication related protein